VNTTTAAQFAMYAAVVPTLGDGAEWETAFVVASHGYEPAMNWKSYPKMGMSEDNLIPTAPTNLTAAQAVNQIDLAWDESPDEDFNYFSIRRGEAAGFNAADPTTEIGTTTSLAFADASIENDKTYYYRVVAFDFNANQGELSAEVNAAVTNIDANSQALPESYALYQNYPNPFNPSTTINFDLPEKANVSIVIYDMRGSKVRTLFNRASAAGRQNVVWNGLNDQGMHVTSGVYIYSIRAGNFVQSKKMTLMK
jgi:methionine-rich copper-binding protein CopC